MDLAYLAACAFHGVSPDSELVSRMNLPFVYKQATRHSLQGITFLALRDYLSSCEDAETQKLFASWQRDYSAAVHKIVYFQPEREKLLSFFEQEGIWYLPLKGIILQNYYPSLGMRQMVDNDIYFNSRYRKAVKSFMAEQGYEVNTYGKGAHDIYIKRPFTFELHVYMYTESISDVFYRYYENSFSRFVKDEDNSFGYHLSHEDFYIHITTHSYKHFTHGGVGLRSLLDVYAFLSQHPELDFDYISRELDTLGISEFESLSRRLAFLLFSSPIHALSLGCSDEDMADLAVFVNSATYGVTRVSVQQAISRQGEGMGAKFRYILSRIFPDMLFYKYNYPFFYKYKVFIPFFVIARFVYKTVLSPVKCCKHLKNIFSK